jgi:hypothetical protein
MDMEVQMISSYITPDGIKLDVEANHGPHENDTGDLVCGLTSDFSVGKYKFQRDFGVLAEHK